jgi:hypothetical protein
MVNSGLKLPRGQRRVPDADSLGADQSVRIFATNAALTNEIKRVESARSRFGSSDS